MILYLFLYLLFVLVGLILLFDCRRCKEKTYLKAFNYSYLFLAFLSAFRYGTGADTPNYMVAFEYIPKLNELTPVTFVLFRFQPLYIILNSLCKTIYNDFVLVQILHVLIFYSGFYMLLKDLGLRKLYLFFIFYCYMYFNPGMTLMREGFALGFCFWGLYFYFKNKWIPYFVLITLGFGCHTGAVLFYFFPFVKWLKPFQSLSFIRLAIFVGSIFILAACFRVLQKDLSVGGDGSIGTRYMMVDEKLDVYNLIRNSVLLFLFYLYCFKRKYNKYADIVYLGVLYCVLDFVGGLYLPMLFRFMSHLSVFFFFCVQIMLREAKHDLKMLAVVIVVVFYQSVTSFFAKYDGRGTEAYTYYCSYFSSTADKRYFNAVIRQSTATDYVLY